MIGRKYIGFEIFDHFSKNIWFASWVIFSNYGFSEKVEKITEKLVENSFLTIQGANRKK
jgi:hypothetical protein